jgi:hypothetical protein
LLSFRSAFGRNSKVLNFKPTTARFSERARPMFGVNLGLGFDLGDRGPGIILKSRFEWHWGNPARQP